MTRLDFGGGAPVDPVPSGRGIDGSVTEASTVQDDGGANAAVLDDVAARLAVRDGDWRALNRRLGQQQDLPQTPVRAAAAARAHGIEPTLLAHASASAVSATVAAWTSRVPTSRNISAQSIQSVSVL